MPNYYEPCQYVANRGIRISEIYARLERAADAGSGMASRILDRLEQPPQVPGAAIPGAPTSITAVERFVEPYHELPYDNREGYDEDFLGRRVRMPMVQNPAAIAAPRIDTTNPRYLLNYEHFSLVMHKERRLAIFTAATFTPRRVRSVLIQRLRGSSFPTAVLIAAIAPWMSRVRTCRSPVC